MKKILIIIGSCIVAYLCVAAIAPNMSFWNEFNTILSKPFEIILQDIPTWLFTNIMYVGEKLSIYHTNNKSAGIIGWLSVIVNILALILTMIYYIVVFITSYIMIMPSGRMSESEIVATHAYNIEHGITDRGFLEHDWSNESKWSSGLISNTEIIKAEVSGTALANALRKHR